MLVCLISLTIVFFLLTLYSVFQSNLDLLEIKKSTWSSFKILDTSTSATLFVTLLGALLVRHQFALSILPRINYKSSISTKPNRDNLNEKFETWRVEIRNTGLGSAIINRTEYSLQLAHVKENFDSCSANAVINELSKNNLIRGQDYWLENIAPGFSLSPKDECVVFEIRTEYAKKLKRLDMVLHFQGQLGDKYLREIRFIPCS